MDRDTELVIQYTPLVHKIVNQYEPKFRQAHWLELEDLVAAGMEGLAKAIRSYKESKGVPFLVYAFIIIGRNIRHYISTANPLTRGQQELYKEGQISFMGMDMVESQKIPESYKRTPSLSLRDAQHDIILGRIIKNTKLNHSQIELVEQLLQGKIVAEIAREKRVTRQATHAQYQVVIKKLQETAVRLGIIKEVSYAEDGESKGE